MKKNGEFMGEEAADAVPVDEKASTVVCQQLFTNVPLKRS